MPGQRSSSAETTIRGSDVTSARCARSMTIMESTSFCSARFNAVRGVTTQLSTGHASSRMNGLRLAIGQRDGSAQFGKGGATHCKRRGSERRRYVCVSSTLGSQTIVSASSARTRIILVPSRSGTVMELGNSRRTSGKSRCAWGDSDVFSNQPPYRRQSIVRSPATR